VNDYYLVRNGLERRFVGLEGRGEKNDLRVPDRITRWGNLKKLYKN
jgi:hypothetical protein